MDLSAAQGPVVLVVDDDADVLETMMHILTTRGFRVFTASGRDSAIAVCQEQGGKIDVLVADLSLPGERTGDLARAISEAYPHIRIVYATGIPRHMALSQGIVRPDAPYLQKPVEPDILAGVLQGVLARNP